MQQPLLGPLDEQQFGSTLPKFKLLFHLSLVGLVIDATIERPRPPGLFQILGKLRPLENRFDLGDEARDFCPEVEIVLSRFEEVQEFGSHKRGQNN